MLMKDMVEKKNKKNNGSSYIAHFTNVPMRFTTGAWRTFFGLHITVPLAAKQLTIMRVISTLVCYTSNWNRLLNRETIPTLMRIVQQVL
jgi:hypothetical protein